MAMTPRSICLTCAILIWTATGSWLMPTRSFAQQQNQNKSTAKGRDGTAQEKKKTQHELKDVVVTGKAPGDKKETYHQRNVTGATLTDTPLIELPQSVEVIPGAMLRERETKSFYESLRYVSGVFNGGRSAHTRTQGQVTLRGFSGSDISLNGAILPRSMPLFFDAVSIERIEFLKGPVAATIGGQTSALGPYGLGGSVNIVSRTPVEDPIRWGNILAELGEGTHGRLSADFNQPFSNDCSGFRTGFAANYTRPFYLPPEERAGRSAFFSPSLAWEISDQVAVRLDSSFQWREGASYQGVPMFQGKFIGGYDTFYGNREGREDYRGFTLQPGVDLKLDENTSIHALASYARADLERVGWGVQTGPPQGLTVEQFYDQMVATGRGPLEYVDVDALDQNTSVMAYGVHDLELGPTQHKLVLGTDWLRKKSKGESLWGSSPETDLRNPTVVVPAPAGTPFTSDSTVDRFGFLFQDQVEWGPVRFLGGIRYDAHKSDQNNKGGSWSPRVGVTVMALENLAVYGNYTHQEAPNFGYSDAEGKELTDSWEGDQVEVGVKAQVFEDMSANLSVFNLRQSNTPEAVPNAPRGVYESGGSTRSRGVEVSLAGHPVEGWNCWLSYTFIDYKDLDADDHFDRFPPHSIALWQTYRFQEGGIKGLQVGAGYRYNDEYLATFRGQKISRRYKVPASHVVDLFVEYPIPISESAWLKDPVVRLGVKNLFNEKYVESIRHAPQAFAGQPLTFSLSLTASL